MHPPQFCIILRGPAGSGKSTLAKEIQRRCRSKTAVIDTDIFNWSIVPGEDDKAVVYENVVTLASNYLRRSYNVIIEGLIISSEEQGVLEQVRKLVAERRAVCVDFYCRVSKDVALGRNEGRGEGVEPVQIEEWWDLAEADKANVSVPLIELDMEAALGDVATKVLDTVTLGGR